MKFFKSSINSKKTGNVCKFNPVVADMALSEMSVLSW